MKRSTQQRRLKWNLRQIPSASAANLAFTRVGGLHSIVTHTGGSNLQLAAETCEFLQDAPLSMGLQSTLSSVLLIQIVGHAFIDD